MADFFIHLIKALFIGLVGWWAIKYLRTKIKRGLVHIYPDDLRVELIVRVITYVLIFIILAAIFQEFNIKISGLLGAAGVLGIAIGFAAQTSVANIISGLFLMIEQPFELGDVLIVNGIEGVVVAVNLFAVTLKTEDGKQVRIPHEQILKNNLTNVTGLPLRRYDVALLVDYKEDPDKVINIVEHVIEQNSLALKEPKPHLQLKNMTGEYWELAVGVWAMQSSVVDLKKSFLKDLKAAFDRSGIKLAVLRYGRE